MALVCFYKSSDDPYPEYAYPTIGSKDQVIEGARVKSTQHPALRGKQWLVIFKSDNDKYTRCIKDGIVT